MSPSELNKCAVAGLLTFVEENYVQIQLEVMEGKHASFTEGVKYKIGQIKSVLENDLNIMTTTDDFIHRCAKGPMSPLLAFMLSCYEDLLKHLHFQNHDSIRATAYQLNSLQNDTLLIHINKNGELVQKKRT
ncbi:MAG: hypothetical protein ACI9AR_000378 [Flavobacteriaceae bacterium]|jgi:hypothetical protein